MKRLPNSTNISMTLISPICRVSALSTEKERAHCGKAFTIICSRQKHVADFHLAEFGEGDAGVTIVTFKK